MRELITHTDLDGLGCIFILQRAGIKFDKIWLCDSPQDFDPFKLSSVEIANKNWRVKRGNELFITDLDIRINGAKIFDHHGDKDGLECGTLLLANYYGSYLTKDDLEFAKSVDAFDRWLEDSPYWSRGVRLQLSFLNHRYLVGRVRDSMRELDQKFRSILNTITLEDDRGIAFQRKRIRNSITQAEKDLRIGIDQAGNSFIYWEFSGEVSFTTNEILKKFKEADYAIIFYTSGRVSARSRNGFDCRSLYGIDGHSSAAGGISSDELLDFLNL